MGERIFASSEGIKITSARAILNGTTYALANVTSVRTYKEPRPLGLLVLAVGLLVFAVLLVGSSPGLAAVVTGCGVLAILGWVFLLHPKFWVRIGTAGAETNAIYYRAEADAVSVVEALNEAIIHRG
jgi:hypothetical protein